MKKIAKTVMTVAATLGMSTVGFAQVPPSSNTPPVAAPTAPKAATPAAPHDAPVVNNHKAPNEAPVAPKAETSPKAPSVSTTDKSKVDASKAPGSATVDTAKVDAAVSGKVKAAKQPQAATGVPSTQAPAAPSQKPVQ